MKHILFGLFCCLLGAAIVHAIDVADTNRLEPAEVPEQIVTAVGYAPITWKHFDSQLNFHEDSGMGLHISFDYPRDFDRISDNSDGTFLGVPGTKFAFPEDAFTNEAKTNFGGAWLNVSAKKDDGHCLEYPNNLQQNISQIEILNGTKFTKIGFDDAAAGSIYSTSLYRLVSDGQCIEISKVLHTGNIANYDPGTVQEFDQSESDAVFNKMFSTLQIRQAANF